MQQGDLREAMSKVDHQIAALSERTEMADGGKVSALATAWADLVKILAIPAAPLVRNCPSCSKAVMSAATLCGFCWSPLVPQSAEAR